MEESIDTKALLLATAFRHGVNEPNIESGFERFSTLVCRRMDYTSFCDAVAACLREGLIREPIRLPEGALQCHWHLELTPQGVAAARIVLETAKENEVSEDPPHPVKCPSGSMHHPEEAGMRHAP